MDHDTSLAPLQRELRASVCPRCRWRPQGSEGLGPLTPRSCEPRCALFIHLPILAEAARVHDPMLESCNAAVVGAIQRIVAHELSRRAAAKADAPRRQHVRLTPLRTYGETVMRVLRQRDDG